MPVSKNHRRRPSKDTLNRLLIPGSAALFLALLLLTTAGAVSTGRTPQAISGVTITNVRDTGFVVSWVTDSATDGHVDWGTGTPPGNTTSDPVGGTSTHYVQISGLSPGTTYFFQVRSGSETDDNGGTYYSVTTGATIPPPTPGRIIFGTIFESDGVTEVPDAIVYVQVRDDDGAGSSGASQWASARADADGLWFIELNNLRSADFNSAFAFSNTSDDLALAWEGGLAGSSASMAAPALFPVPSSYPAQFDVNLDPGGGPTETPSATVPLPTDTSTPTSTTGPPTGTPTATGTGISPTDTPTMTPSPTETVPGPTPVPTATATGPVLYEFIYLPVVIRAAP